MGTASVGDCMGTSGVAAILDPTLLSRYEYVVVHGDDSMENAIDAIEEAMLANIADVTVIKLLHVLLLVTTLIMASGCVALTATRQFAGSLAASSRDA